MNIDDNIDREYTLATTELQDNLSLILQKLLEIEKKMDEARLKKTHWEYTLKDEKDNVSGKNCKEL